jgi:hypothetical protein
MVKKHEKKQWLLQRLAKSTAALTLGAVFILSPGQTQAVAPSQVPLLQPVMNRLQNIKRMILEQQNTKDEANDRTKMPQLLAQTWPNWSNTWRNGG